MRSGACWTRRVVKRMALLLMAGMVAVGCSSPPHVSLANDQAAVNAAQAAVAGDQASQQALTAGTPQSVECLGDPGSAVCLAYEHNLNAQGAKLDAKLKADQFKLQVAEDQLKKDEG